MNGMKTGYTSSAGYCISATAMREQLQLIAVVMAEPSIEVRSKDITAMLNYGFANYTMVSVTPEQPVMTVPVLRGKSDRVLCTLQRSEPLLMTREQGKTYTVTTELEDEVQAPVTAGQQLGQVVVRAGERELARFPVTAAEDVPALTLWDCWKQLFFKLFD
jgi:D-alanyl-D-alanine carboxypeptidase (penicillin-binding protein 5/6)